MSNWPRMVIQHREMHSVEPPLGIRSDGIRSVGVISVVIYVHSIEIHAVVIHSVEIHSPGIHPMHCSHVPLVGIRSGGKVHKFANQFQCTRKLCCLCEEQCWGCVGHTVLSTEVKVQLVCD